MKQSQNINIMLKLIFILFAFKNSTFKKKHKKPDTFIIIFFKSSPIESCSEPTHTFKHFSLKAFLLVSSRSFNFFPLVKNCVFGRVKRANGKWQNAKQWHFVLIN